MRREKTTIITISLLTLVFVAYFLNLIHNSKAFVDAWVLEGILWPSLTLLIIIALLSYLLFPNKKAVVFSLSIYTFLIIILPILKYPNKINIVGCWDSLAHYSFSNWILLSGSIPHNANLIYSILYGFHPGNGVLPSILSLVSKMTLGFSMNTILISSYLVYILLLYSITVSRQPSRAKETPLITYLFISAIFSLLFLWYYYVGMTISYGFIAIILYYVLKWIALEENISLNSYALLIIVFLGLLVTHLSSCSLIFLFLTLFCIFLNVIIHLCSSYNKVKLEFNVRVFNSFLISLIAIYILYQFFVDYLLTHSLVKSAIKIIQGFYMREFYLVSSRVGLYKLSLGELVRMGIAMWPKYLIIVLVAMSLFVYMLIRRMKKEHSSFFLIDSIIGFMILIAGMLWFVGYVATGELMQGGRAIPILQFIVVYSILLFVNAKDNTYTSTERLKSKIKILIFIFLLFLGIISNYGLQPVAPTLRVENYNMKTSVAIGPVSDYVLSAIEFTNAYISTGVTFIGLEPYITFGYMDLLWNVTLKKVITKDLATTNDTLVALNEIFKHSKDIVIAMTPYDNVVPGKLGYKGFYEVPTMYLSKKCNLIYSNKYYMLFYW